MDPVHLRQSSLATNTTTGGFCHNLTFVMPNLCRAKGALLLKAKPVLSAPSPLVRQKQPGHTKLSASFCVSAFCHSIILSLRPQTVHAGLEGGGDGEGVDGGVGKGRGWTGVDTTFFNFLCDKSRSVSRRRLFFFITLRSSARKNAELA